MLSFLLHCTFVLLVIMSCRANNKLMDGFICILLLSFYVFLICTRYGYGVDEPTYKAAYESYLMDSSSFEFDYSFRFIYYLFSIVGIDAVDFNNFICIVYISFSLIVVVFTVNSPYRSLVLLFLIFNSVSLDFIFNGYRQGFSFLAIVLAVYLYEKNRILYSFLFCIIGIGFHWAAVLVLIFYLLARVLKNSFSERFLKLVVVFIICISFVVFIIPPGINVAINDFISSFGLSGKYVEKVNIYLSLEKGSLYELNFFGRFPLFVNVVITLFFVWYNISNIPKSIVLFVIMLFLYGILFIDMAFSFRNFYWVNPLLPFLIGNSLRHQQNNGVNTNSLVVLYCGLHVIISVVTYYTSVITDMVFVG